ncbi:MAG: transglutaminase-like cysteine peptidase [Cycloclasticus sp.]|nr:transglutaminase-like cysteine peptidase [Cycloclasticus sp.]MBQ0790394.1 transglutaminase-like cysteine peptidase [Cycloclasticus sp.]
MLFKRCEFVSVLIDRFKQILFVICVLTLVGCASTPKPALETPFVEGIKEQTQARVNAWKTLVKSGTDWPDNKKLNSVNDFINQLVFVDDIVHWKQEDYWATPLQSIVSNGGDCEDFSIAKYFTLSAMGLDEKKLRLTYVKALSINKPHMVVSYFSHPTAEPLLLDNLNEQILPASKRPDLLPVYSFNGSGLWLAKREHGGAYAGSSSRISLWQKLRQSMDVEAANESQHICLYQYYDLPDQRAKTFCPQTR